MSPDHTASAPSLAPRSTRPAAEPPLLDSRQIFHTGLREVQIDHHGVRYRLRVTALGKLILTK